MAYCRKSSPITEAFPASLKVKGVCKRLDIKTMADFERCPRRLIEGMAGIGRKTMDEIDRQMEKAGVGFCE